MIDPISSIRTLINRYETYRKIQECDFETKGKEIVWLFVCFVFFEIIEIFILNCRDCICPSVRDTGVRKLWYIYPPS